MNNNHIWEWPIRVFHWAMVLLVFALLGSGFTGYTEPHLVLGQILMGLLIFRFFWGFCGGYYSRFSTGLKIIFGKTDYDGFGHSKTGWLSTFAIMGFLFLHILSGMFSTTDEVLAGPLAKFLEYELSRTLNFIHAEIGAKIVIGLIIIHILAIMYYLNEKNPQIVGSMFHGRRKHDTMAKPVVFSYGWLGICVVLAVLITLTLGNL